MTFRKDSTDFFKQHFDSISDRIRDFPGCEGLLLMQDREDNRIFFTFSEWRSPEDLEAYRKSELFLSTWKKVKQYFDDKAEAWSVDSYWESNMLR